MTGIPFDYLHDMSVSSSRIRGGVSQIGAAVFLAACLLSVRAKEAPTPFTTVGPGIAYVNRRMPEGPWSIHIVQVDRKRPDLSVASRHAGPGAVGLSTLSEQIGAVPAGMGSVEVAINGDFYQRDRAYAGDSRELQIVNGELVSAPTGGVAFWIDSAGNPAVGPVASRIQVSWPDGASTPVGFNEDRKVDAVVVYTSAVGTGTRTIGGREWILEPEGSSPPQPVAVGSALRFRVREVREAGNSSIASNQVVLSMGPALVRRAMPVPVGSVITLSLATTPPLNGVPTAIGGGPVLVQGGRRQKIKVPSADSYEFSSMMERHPRSAIGWNRAFFYFVEVDGRQKELSVGMTLDELSEVLVSLGCEEAMNLDGGGSSTLWCTGKIRNSPCDGHERPIANSLMILRSK